MDKLKKILFKKYYIREMILLFFIVLSLLFLSVYSSFALFEKTVEKVGIASIQSHDLEISLSKTSITVPANETVFEDITLTNTSDISVKYKLYTTTTSNDVQVGISSKSEYEASGTLSAKGYAGDEKTVRIAATNNSSSSQIVTVGVESGYTHNEIVLESGNQDFDTTIEESSGYVDPSGANSPVLAEGMIPVIYDETCESSSAKDNASGCWEVANTNTAWYNYDEQMWANAVTTSVGSYRTASAGTEIPMDDINSMWVWIPRYKYKIRTTYGTHADGTPGTQTEPGLIDVVFESNTETTGTDSNIAVGSDYYTHPAFTFGEEDLTGFWVGKFETSGSATHPTIKPGFVRLDSLDVKTCFETSLVFSGGTFNSSTGTVTFSTNASNIYGLNTTNNTTNTHMAKNMEWGSVAYLSQSIYGKMGNSNYSGTNKEIYKNVTWSYYSGFSGGSPIVDPSSDMYFYNDAICKYESCTSEKEQFKGVGASTTGTIYGIYDMNGGKTEYVMANYIDTPSNSGFTTYPESKYIDKILIQGSRGYIKGEATGETRNWYQDTGYSMYYETPWYTRGGDCYSDEKSGIFSYALFDGSGDSYLSFRTVLIP